MMVLGLIIERINKYKSSLKRGIYEKSYSVTTLGVQTHTIDAQFEVAEIERTNDKSKVIVLSVNAGDNSHKSDRLKNMVHNTWILTSEIEWIEKPLDMARDEKIDQLLK